MNIYVGNISYTTTEQNLMNHFSSIGAIDEVKIITDRETGRSKGFAFVTMSNNAEAKAAIAELNGSELQNRQLVVNEAREKKSY